LLEEAARLASAAGHDLADMPLRLHHIHVHGRCLYEWNHVMMTNQVFLYQT
jgi:hypothetical protein